MKEKLVPPVAEDVWRISLVVLARLQEICDGDDMYKMLDLYHMWSDAGGQDDLHRMDYRGITPRFGGPGQVPFDDILRNLWASGHIEKYADGHFLNNARDNRGDRPYGVEWRILGCRKRWKPRPEN